MRGRTVTDVVEQTSGRTNAVGVRNARCRVDPKRTPTAVSVFRPFFFEFVRSANGLSSHRPFSDSGPPICFAVPSASIMVFRFPVCSLLRSYAIITYETRIRPERVATDAAPSLFRVLFFTAVFVREPSPAGGRRNGAEFLVF